MNYRHAYHAGNFADVHKHAVVAWLVERLKTKPGPFAVLDTHAGIGRYDLEGTEASKTGEWRGGIGLVLDAPDPPAALTPLLDVVRGLNPQGGLRHYPGSPWVAARLMRPGDRLALNELHPDDHALLAAAFAGDRRVHVQNSDGYGALKAWLPPPERRGLVLIDPPFEVVDELARLRAGLAVALKRWATGTYVLWYPIKSRAATDAFRADLAMAGIDKALAAELLIHPADDPFRLNGSGLVVVNPPWKLDEALAEMLPWLVERLAPGRASWRLGPLIPSD